jgi:hypothetical protein
MKNDKIIPISEEVVEQKLRAFDDLLKDIENTAGKKKELWRQIYINANSDRHNAFIVFDKLFKVVTNEEDETVSSTEMAIHGKTLASYLDIMKRANDQLVKLAELVAAEEEKRNKINTDDAYAIIANSK